MPIHKVTGVSEEKLVFAYSGKMQKWGKTGTLRAYIGEDLGVLVHSPIGACACYYLLHRKDLELLRILFQDQVTEEELVCLLDSFCIG